MEADINAALKFAAVSLALALCASAASAQVVGVAGAVNTDATGTPPGGATRVVLIGNNVVMRERIVTGGQGTVQLVFTDQSTLTIGRNSEVVIDEYVYNPADKKGNMSVSMQRGVMRFVGGQLSHQGNATVNTPRATLGVRGGIVMVQATAQETVVVNIFGNTTVIAKPCPSGADCSAKLLRPGFATRVSGDSGKPEAPFQAAGDLLGGMQAALQSSPNQSGGAPTRPNDTNAQQANTGQSQGVLVAHMVQPQAPQGGAVQPISATTPSLVNGPSATNNGALDRLPQNAAQNLAVGGGVEPTNFPPGITSLGDLRTVTAPRTFNYSQTGVTLFNDSAAAVGSYNFSMTVTLGSNPATRGFNATASNINVPSMGVSGFMLNFTTTNDFSGFPNTVIGYGSSTMCASGVDCHMGFYMNNVGGHVAKTVNHSVTVWNTGAPSPPLTPAPGVVIGSGVVTRP